MAAWPARPKLTSMATQSLKAKHNAVPPVQLSRGQSIMQAATSRSRGGHTSRWAHARSRPELALPRFSVKSTCLVTLRLLCRAYGRRHIARWASQSAECAGVGAQGCRFLQRCDRTLEVDIDATAVRQPPAQCDGPATPGVPTLDQASAPCPRSSSMSILLKRAREVGASEGAQRSACYPNTATTLRRQRSSNGQKQQRSAHTWSIRQERHTLCRSNVLSSAVPACFPPVRSGSFALHWELHWVGAVLAPLRRVNM